MTYDPRTTLTNDNTAKIVEALNNLSQMIAAMARAVEALAKAQTPPGPPA